MNVLFLGYEDSPLVAFLRDQGENVIATPDKISPELLLENQIEFAVSYGYRHLIKKEILDLLPERVINLHISLLPWNKGADPNFWSFVEESPKGVTIHLVDEGLDTGEVLLQRKVEMSEQETMRSSYGKLQEAIQALFCENWESLKSGQIMPQSQIGEGTSHRVKDKKPLLEGIEDRWLDMPVTELLEIVQRSGSDSPLWDQD